MSEQELQQEPVSTHLGMRDVGKIFSDAREQAGLSLEEAATRLCLRHQQVEAMERGAVDELPGQTFVRGFIRSYAKLLHLDAEPLVEAHRRHAPATSAGNISLQSEHITIVEPTRRGWGLYLRVAAVIGMVLGAGLVYMDYFAERPAATQSANEVNEGGVEHERPLEDLQTEAAVQPMMPDMSELAAAQPSPVPVPQPEAAQPVAVPPPAAQPDAVAQSPATAPVATATLKLTFTETSWVRVRDRDGHDLLNKTAVAGGVEQVVGMPPLRLEIGNTNGVQLSYRDQPVDLVPHARANVARFTLE